MSEYPSLVLLLDAYLSSAIPLYEFRGQFYSGQIQPADETEDGLYRAVSMHLAMYTAGDWPQEELKSAIRWHMASRAGQPVSPPIPMLDKQWMDIMKSGLAPWPLTVQGLE